MNQPIKVTLKRLENDYVLCQDEHGHQFYLPTDLLPEQKEGAVICLKLMLEHEATPAFEAKEILNAILAEKIT